MKTILKSFVFCSVLTLCAYAQKIADMPAVPALSGTAAMSVAQSGTTYRTTVNGLLGLLSGTGYAIAWSNVTGEPLAITALEAAGTPSANTIPLFSSGSTASYLSVPLFSQTLIGSASASSARATLGLAAIAASGSWSDLADKPDPVITANGDASGAVTLTDLASGTLALTLSNTQSGNHLWTGSNNFAGGLGINGVSALSASGNSGATTATVSGSGALARTLADRFADTISIKDFGAIGDGVTDDTEAIQKALNTKRSVIVPSGTYVISDALQMKGAGQIIRGESPWKSVIRQMTASEHAIEINAQNLNDQVVQGNELIFNQRIEGLGLLGVGSGSSSASGIITSGTGVWNGDWLQVRNTTVRGFDVGINLVSVGQVSFDQVLCTYNASGVRMTGSALNSYRLNGLQIVHSGTGLYIDGGAGNSYFLGDMGNNTTDVYVATGGGTFIGGNYESSGRCFDVATNAGAVIVGARFLRTSSTTPPIRVAAAAGVFLLGTGQAGQVAGTPLVEKTTTTAVVGGFTSPSASNLGSTDNAAYSFVDNSQTFRVVPWPTRYSNSIPSASSGLRGQILQVIGAGGADYVGQYLLDHNGTAILDEWSNYRLRVTTAAGGTPLSLAAQTRYRATAGSAQVFTLPASAQVDDEIEIIGVGNGGVTVAQNSGQTIRIGSHVTTSGTGGYLTLTSADTVRLKCTTGTTTWRVIGYTGNPKTDTGAAPVMTGTATWAVSSLATLSTYEQLIPVPGVPTTARGIDISFSGTLANGLIPAAKRVVSTGTVGVSLYNATGGDITDTSTVISVRVVQP